eukprot:10209227-Lingulodinium_polyedra.AAC.1
MAVAGGWWLAVAGGGRPTCAVPPKIPSATSPITRKTPSGSCPVPKHTPMAVCPIPGNNTFVPPKKTPRPEAGLGADNSPCPMEAG